MLDFTYRLCLFCGLAFVVAAGLWLALFGATATPGEALVFESPEQDLGDMPVAVLHTIEFPIHNRSAQPYQIIGIGQS